MEEIKVYTIQEVADLLKCTKQTVRKYINEGEMQASMIGRKFLITAESVKEFIKSRQV